MATPTRAELLDVWTRRATATGGGRWLRATIDLLADGVPVDATRIAAATGMSESAAAEQLVAARTVGYELDNKGRLVGAALTLNPTPYHFRVRGNDLYAWCGFDTLFLPILLGERATVTSTCPETRRGIELTVEADGTFGAVTPATATVAIVGHVVTCRCHRTGPNSDVCAQMPLLADPDAADRWTAQRAGVAAVDLHDASGLARAYVRALLA